MSIVRVGLAETRNFAEGYDAIFRKKASGARGARQVKKTTGSKASASRKKKAAKKK